MRAFVSADLGGKQVKASPNPAAVDTNGDPVDRNPFRYASGYFDTTTGMLKYGTRYYMPSLMRWTQPDPVAGKPTNPMGLSRYAYVGCNPVSFVDPTGRSCAGAIVTGIFATIGLAASSFSLFTVPLTGGLSTIAIIAGFEASVYGIIDSVAGIVNDC